MIKKLSALFLMVMFVFISSCKPEIIPPEPPRPEPDPEPESGFVEVVPSPKEWDKTKRADISYQLLMYSYADKDGDGWGDIQGLISKLDHIDQIGATAIWLSPIHPSGSYHGYDVKDYAGIDEKFGSMDDFKTLVAEAEKRDIKIYLDYVINHSSKSHPWFLDAISSPNSEYKDYYIFSDNPQSDITAGNIPMIAKEGSRGYEASQWYSIASTEEANYLFTLNWSNSSSPTITVTTSNTVDGDNPDASTNGAKYLYYGDPAVCAKFYDKGNSIYTLNVKYSSPWGFLIRTSNSEDWPAGTKYGGKGGNNTITLGEAFRIYTDQDNNNVGNVMMPGGTMYHSHFWTDWFADLNFGSVETAESSPAFKAIVKDAKMWIDAGIAGLRLDAVKHIYHDAKSDENPKFLKKFYEELNGYYRASHSEDIYMVGEVLSGAHEVAPYYLGLPAYFEFSFWWKLKDGLNSGQGCYFVKDILSYQDLYKTFRPDNFIVASKLSNHDENRTRSDLLGSIGKSKLAGAVLLSAGGSPYIYYGEELGYIGTKSGGDEYVRSPMLWGDSYTTSYTTKIDSELSKVGTVISQTEDEESILRVYQDFSRVRNSYPALAQGSMTKHSVYNESNATSFPSVGAWYRSFENEKALVLHNFSPDYITLPLDDIIKNTIVSQGTVQMKETDNKFTIKMGPYSSVIFEL